MDKIEKSLSTIKALITRFRATIIRLLTFFITGLIAYYSLRLVIGKLTIVKAFAFWLIIDVVHGVGEIVVEKLAVYRQNFEETFLDIVWLFFMLVVLIALFAGYIIFR